MNIEQTQNYQRLSEEAMNRKQIKDFYPESNQNNQDINWEDRNKQVNNDYDDDET